MLKVCFFSPLLLNCVVLTGAMEPLDSLPVRFHLGGQFDYDGYGLNYVGGAVAMSYLDRYKVSLSELRGFLADHVTLSADDNIDFHWLTPGTEINNGLQILANDQACLHMCTCITEGGVAEIYVEVYNAHRVIKVGDQLGFNAANERRVRDDQTLEDIEKVRQVYSSPGNTE